MEKNSISEMVDLAEPKQNEENLLVCENCHAIVDGDFCSRCGQSIDSKIKYFWTVILHLLDDILSFDSRASRTLFPLIFRPGFLTKEYFAGRRVHYVPPLRLYLFVSIIFFLFLRFVVDPGAIKSTQIENYAQLAEQQISELKERQLKLSDEENQPLSKPVETATPLADIPESALDHEAALNRDMLEQQIAQLNLHKQYLIDTRDPLFPKIAMEAIKLEIRKIERKSGLVEKDQKKLARAITQLEQLNRGENVTLDDDQFTKVTFLNSPDGTIRFDFLSDEANNKIQAFAKQLEQKSKKAFNGDLSGLVTDSISKLPQLMFVLLPIFAFLLKIMFMFSKRLYMEHLTVALHSHSFIFVIFLIAIGVSELAEVTLENSPIVSDILNFIAFASLSWMPIYLFIMHKKVYRQGLILTSFKYMLIGNLYLLLLVFTSTIAFIWGLTDVKI